MNKRKYIFSIVSVFIVLLIGSLMYVSNTMFKSMNFIKTGYDIIQITLFNEDIINVNDESNAYILNSTYNSRKELVDFMTIQGYRINETEQPEKAINDIIFTKEKKRVRVLIRDYHFFTLWQFID